MTVEITGVEIGAEKITIEAINLETILMRGYGGFSDNLRV